MTGMRRAQEPMTYEAFKVLETMEVWAEGQGLKRQLADDEGFV